MSGVLRTDGRELQIVLEVSGICILAFWRDFGVCLYMTLFSNDQHLPKETVKLYFQDIWFPRPVV